MRIRQGVDPDIVIRLPDGTHAAIAMRLTSYLPAPAPDLPIAPTPLLALDGLRHVVQLLERARAEGRLPMRQARLADQPADARYD